ncbi:chondroitin sulfate synthase 1 [Bicyclus anynana]|uniref:Hexosyltransferase n=1 Tax=Bicyclus anynana TaxID=110368 RepID=A0A6J1NL08_BICAN|nr:chondroitin sulfate synthase 1 [Bicyclus anynana]
MPRRSKWMHLVAGVVAGVTLGVFLKLCLRPSSRTSIEACPNNAKLYVAPDPLSIVDLKADETLFNSNRTLVFVGVMTAEQYLTSRARAVYETWAQDLPGRIAFFSSEVSRAPGLPLIPLRSVDDSYPPQKKSFLMLLYMFEHYGERFEWFMRADDDVYVRGDKLGEFLRSVDSRKPQFIGQAGRGTNNEKDALALDYNENFCMGGPGVLISRETMRRVAPHVKYCLKHLYTTHEDVELGRCVAKFAGVSCTWSYDMQTILHHNGSGAEAYTGRLKKREVHRAITLHPVKDHRQMYRLHTYFKNLRIQELREQSLDLHRDIQSSARELGVKGGQVTSFVLPGGVPLFTAKMGEPGYLGDNRILGAPIDFNRYKADRVEDIVPFDFITKSIHSVSHSNPKRRLETPLKEALDDVIREVMEIINAPSRQRGRVIDFNELLYGYTRLQPVHGVDHVLDLLLKYRRYRGRKMTAAVRRHAYLQQCFTGTEIRELPMGEPAPIEDAEILEQLDINVKNYQNDYDDFDDPNNNQNSFLDIGNLNMRQAFENSLLKIHNNLPKMLQWSNENYEYAVYDRQIHFILPLLGRFEIFNRFMKNYEDIVLKSDEAVSLTIVLFLDAETPLDYENSETLVNHFKSVYRKDIKIVAMGAATFSRGAALTEGLKECSTDDLVSFIDVDMMFNHISLRRIRINTIKYNQVYFPIVFSQYNPEVVYGDDYNKFKEENTEIIAPDNSEDNDGSKSDIELANLKYSGDVDNDFGYFRQYGFGILSIFKCDFERVGGFDLNIKGWGLEDVQLFETLIKSNLTVYRIADETLVHIFHSVDCDSKLEKSQFLMCLGTKASTYGSDKHMTYYMLNHPEVLWPQKVKGAS